MARQPDHFVPLADDLRDSLDHQNIMKFRESDADGRRICHLKEFSERMAQNAPLSDLEQVNIFLQASSGLKYLHSRNIIHCSIGLRNIIVVQQNKQATCRVKLFLDFTKCGLEVGGSERRKFKPWITTNLFGDLSPPEAGPGRKKKIHYTGKIDVYFLGIAMLEVATTEKKGGVLRYLWPGDYYSPEETAGRLPDSQPLKQVILKCLQPNPEERIRSSDVHHYLLQSEYLYCMKLVFLIVSIFRRSSYVHTVNLCVKI
jgi:serine/threonine protein kinase